jgi:predicted flap endonuclease-1-like 5' DNA nuclease
MTNVGNITNVLIALVAGLLIGWLIEWIIDWFYWRRPKAETAAPSEPEKVERYDSPPPDPDDLTAIKGIGPVIEKRLNQAGIYKYEQLAGLTLDEFEEALGNLLERFINERAILRQARVLADKKKAGV